MQSQQRFELIVDLDGNFQIEALGYQGKDCKKDSQPLEELLGTVVKVEEKTEFFLQTETTQQKQYEA